MRRSYYVVQGRVELDATAEASRTLPNKREALRLALFGKELIVAGFGMV